MGRTGWHTCQPPDLHNLARSWFMHARRIELQKLAQELGISRATAYRWAGSAEQLVGEVLASIVQDTFQNLSAKSEAAGTQKVLGVLSDGMRYTCAFQPLLTFLEANPQTGLKLLAAGDSPVHTVMVKTLSELLTSEALSLNTGVETVAESLVRVMDSCLYVELLSGGEPDIKAAERIMGAMLEGFTADAV